MIKALAMTAEEIRLFSLAPVQPIGQAPFADPEWRGVLADDASERRLRPLCEIHLQISRLASWIAAGADYGWLGAYQARRAGFELQSVRAQISHEADRKDGTLADADRRAVQARLDRLEDCLEAARISVGVG
jgi:hypothetical protein